MFLPKESVFDRFEQSFVLFKNNFVKLFFPIFLFNFFTIILFWSIVKYKIFNEISWTLTSFNDLFTFLNSSTFVMIVSLFMIWLILYLILYIPFFIWLVKTISQIFDWKIATPKKNLYYWFKNLSWIFKTYWYIFVYITLFPIILFLFWWFLIIFQNFFKLNEIFKIIWFSLVFLSIIFFITFLIYRKLKTTFSLYWAIDKDKFDKNNFNFSVYITNNNWWRIVWNIIVAWIIIWVISSIISIFVKISWTSSTLVNVLDIQDFQNLQNITFEDLSIKLKIILDVYLKEYSIVLSIFSDLINNIIELIWFIFIVIFNFIFYRRLEIENITLWKEEVKLLDENYIKENINTKIY